MNMKTLILPASLALVLAACGTTYHGNRGHQGHQGHQHGHAHQGQAGQAENFSCRNGLSVTVRHLGNDRVELRLDDKQTVMSAAVSGSGERYVSTNGLFGSGAEWHQKGGDAAFSFKDPYGNTVDTTCSRRR